jgi:hypothetical protein
MCVPLYAHARTEHGSGKDTATHGAVALKRSRAQLGGRGSGAQNETENRKSTGGFLEISETGHASSCRLVLDDAAPDRL